jgi:hypothetical protein
MSADQPGRVTLRAPDSTRLSTSYIDGGWWPRSQTLSAEVGQLLSAVSQAGFDTYRVIYQLDGWAQTPRREMIDGRRVTLSGYHQQAAHTVALIDESGQNRLVLLVIPPETDGSVAQRALDIAGSSGDADSADQVLERALAG